LHAQRKKEKMASRKLRGKPRTRYTELGVVETELFDKTSEEFSRRLEVEYIHPQFNKPMFQSPGGVREGVGGAEFNAAYIHKHGLSDPVKFASSERSSLGIKLPERDITPRLVSELVGTGRSIVAMNVATQTSNVNMKLADWANYFETPELRTNKAIDAVNILYLMNMCGTPLMSS
jgi:hypothetical protein